MKDLIKGIVSKELLLQWNEMVSSPNADHHVMFAAYHIIKKVAKGGTLSEVKEVFDKQNHSNASATLVLRVIERCCPNGKELAKQL